MEVSGSVSLNPDVGTAYQLGTTILQSPVDSHDIEDAVNRPQETIGAKLIAKPLPTRQDLFRTTLLSAQVPSSPESTGPAYRGLQNVYPLDESGFQEKTV